MAAIHFGTAGSTPGFGRPCHCFHAITRNSRPSSKNTTATAVDVPESASSASLATSSTMTLTTTSARTQPTAKARPLERAFGVPSMRMMAMIGTGLIATPIADGSRSPIACPMAPERRSRPSRAAAIAVRAIAANAVGNTSPAASMSTNRRMSRADCQRLRRHRGDPQPGTHAT